MFEEWALIDGSFIEEQFASRTVAVLTIPLGDPFHFSILATRYEELFSTTIVETITLKLLTD